MSKANLQIELDHSYLIINKQEATIKELEDNKSSHDVRCNQYHQAAEEREQNSCNHIKKLEAENKDLTKARDKAENLPLCNMHDRDACVAKMERLEAENAQLIKQLDLHKLNHEHGEALTDLSQSIGVDDE